MPMGKYKDFDDCVRKNSDKEDPKAYCGTIKAAVEGTSMPDFQANTTLRVHIDDSAVFEEVDGRMMATVRILRAGKSKNRRNYSPHVVEEAVKQKVFDGALMFKDHDRKRGEPQQRGVDEMVSVIESTSYDAPTQSAIGRVEFFDRPFYQKAQAAKDRLGVSINALVKGTRQVIAGVSEEDITGWGRGRSVDWVLFPSAGGQIMAFEDEDVDPMIDWSKVTPEELQKNNPAAYEAIQALAEPKKEAEDPPKPPVDNKKPEGDFVAKEDVQKMVAQALEDAQKAAAEKQGKISATATKIRQAFEKSGLPPRTRTRIMASFEGEEEFDEAAVAESIKNAKEELDAAGAGPRITGMGPSDGTAKAETGTFSVHESVRSSLLGPQKKTEEKEAAK